MDADDLVSKSDLMLLKKLESKFKRLKFNLLESALGLVVVVVVETVVDVVVEGVVVEVVDNVHGLSVVVVVVVVVDVVDVVDVDDVDGLVKEATLTELEG